MPDSFGDEMICGALRRKLEEKHALAAESAHLEGCDACLEVWLDATVAEALDAKPEVRVPADFAARVAAGLPEKRGALRGARRRGRQWGLITAVLLVAMGLAAAALADPGGLNSRMGLVFMALVVSEIAGIGLWLGTGRSGGGRS
jgi:hypothetical protein